ncbi:MAG: RHS repeat domain-containing protein [Bacteroidota bacterium]
MKRTMLVLCHTLLMGLASVLVAQELPTIIPPSPEAASFGKFTEIPISHYTGVPNIAVPITSFSVGGKTFPVSISYHARGIQVAETASRVGLGWALSAGGQITRQVRHKADDGFTGFQTRANIHDTVFTNGTDTNSPSNNANLASDLATQFIETSDYDYDKIPDLFTLQGGGLSSKFIINYDDDQPLLQKYDDVIIERKMGTSSNVHGIAGFVVTDKNGYIYYYGIDSNEFTDSIPVANVDWTQKKYTLKANGTYDLVDPGQQNVSMADEWSLYPYYNSWQLTEIVSPNGERAKLIYNKETSYMYRRSGDKFNTGATANEQLHCYANLVRVEQYQLAEIRYDFDTGGSYKKVVFEANDARDDMHYTGDDHIDGSSGAWPSDAKELDAIKIYDGHNTLVSTFSLSHSYMVSNEVTGYLPILSTKNPSARRRLVLDSITESGTSVSKPPYKFSYNSTPLPMRHSNSKDYWGHYNGVNNGSFLAGYGLDRRVDTTFSEAGMLKKITYPTGGSTRFTYGHNKGHKGSEFNTTWLPSQYNGIFLPKINPSSENSIGLSNLGFTSGLYNDTGGLNGGYYQSDRFSVTTTAQFSFNVQLPTWNGADQNVACVSTPLGSCEFSIRLVPIDGNNLPDPNNAIDIWADSTPINISSGEYQLEVHVPSGWNPQAQADSGQFFIVGLTWDDQVADQGTLLYAAGKRIEQIEFLDSGDNVVSKKTYDYNNSGIILGISDFTYSVTVDLGAGPVVTSLAPWHLYSTYQGNTIGYKFVEEYFGDKSNNSGKRSYNFLVTKDSGDFIGNPLTPPTDNEWLRGLPLQIIDYKNNGDGTYSRVKQVDNDYLVANDHFRDVLPLPLEFPDGLPNAVLTPETQYFMLDTPVSSTIDPTGAIPATSALPDIFYQKTDTTFVLPFVIAYTQKYIHFTDPGTGGILQRDKIKIFHFTGGTLDTSKTKSTLYDANENPTIVDSTLTAFNYAKHYQPDMVTTVGSDGEPVVQSFTYPQELASGYTVHPTNYNTNPITALAEQHRFVPLETMTFRDADADGVADLGEETSKSKTTFAWFPDTLTQDVLEPTLVQTGKDTDPGSVTLTDRIDFKDYDSDGNVLQVSKADGMDITYIYGYHNTLPVAKIENATYAQVSSHVANIQAKSDLDDDNCQDSGSCDEKNLRTALDGLRTAFPDAMVTTYTYDPLIGITSMTDPKGYTVYYEYDGLNRLVRVKDEDGNVMSENKYHYLLDN